jgi:hypothetical protein
LKTFNRFAYLRQTFAMFMLLLSGRRNIRVETRFTFTAKGLMHASRQRTQGDGIVIAVGRYFCFLRFYVGYSER